MVPETLMPPALAQALDQYSRATIGNDTVALSRLFTDDYILVNSDSSVQNRQSYLKDFLVPGFKVDPYEMRERVFKLFGDTAVTGGAFHLGWTLDGRHQRRHLRIAHVWIRKHGRWQIAYTQLTRVPE